MKILLVAVNAKYIHSNLAVYSLKKYAGEFGKQIEIAEYTINNYAEEIRKDIYQRKPDVIAFSCYIWNIAMVDQVGTELKKIMPDVSIWVGGPEVSYNPKQQLETKPWIDGVIVGEGEESFRQLSSYYICKKPALSEIAGLYYRNGNAFVETGYQNPLNLSDIPFPYDNLESFENKLVYYESSRGCPFSCSYCLSSIEKGIRLRDVELVKKELQLFIDNKIPLVKFIDRTFNANHDHAMAIWKYIYEHDEGHTSFHFEISADLLREDEIELVSRFRPGLIQFEIGVQTINEQTIEAIHRRMDLEKLEYAVRAVAKNRNIHQHLDLIAGLPYEDLESFKQSFDYVYRLRPDQLQLGFLKVLKGSCMHEMSKEYEIAYTDAPPFEVLSTKWLSYDDVLALKKVEDMVEVYYNSGQFQSAIAYLENYFNSPYELYEALGEFYEKNHYLGISHTRIRRYEILRDFYKEEIIKGQEDFFQYADEAEELTNDIIFTDDAARALDVFMDAENDDFVKTNVECFEGILLYDLYLRENLKSRPQFAKALEAFKDEMWDFYQREDLKETYLPTYEKYTMKQISRMTHLEIFDFDLMKSIKEGCCIKGRTRILFDYENRNPLNHQAKTFEV